jgi:O-antigen/teichoic acid export membrane protein
MLPRKALIKSTAIYTIGGALPLASSIILLPFYTNLISLSNFGLLALYIAFTLFVQMLVGFGFDIYISIHYHNFKNNTEELKKLVGSVVTILLVIGSLVTVLSLLGGHALFSHIFSHNSLTFFPYGFMCVMTAICNSMFKTYANFLIARERADEFLWSSLFNFILTVAISIAGLYLFPNSIAGPMWGRLLSGVGIFGLALYRLVSEFGITFHYPTVKNAWKFCAPNVLGILIIWASGNIDRYIIQHYLQNSDVGVYDFAMKTTMLIEFAINGLSSAVFPKICAIWKENNLRKSTSEDNKYMHIVTALIILIVAVNILIIPTAVIIAVKKESYYIALTFVPVLCLGYLFRSLSNAFTWPLFFFNATSKLPIALGLSTAMQLGISFWAIQRYGLWGMVWISIIAKIIQIIFLWAFSKKTFSYTFNYFKMVGLPLLYAGCVIILYYVFPIGLWAGFLQLIFAGLLVFIAFRKEIKALSLTKLFSK